MKLISWNVNGVRAIQNKGFADSVKAMNPDILCLQETKAQEDQVAEALSYLKDYHIFANQAEKKGYSGTAIISRDQPLNLTKGIGIAEHDQEGRVLTAEYPDFYLVTVYTPNSGQGLKRLDYRKQWDADFLKFIQGLEKTKPVVICGDLNVCHQEIDIARPKANYNKSAGYTQVEIDGFEAFMKHGLTDTFRAEFPDRVAYSWWSFRAGARGKNIGWRLDYFLTSEGLSNGLAGAEILSDVMGSDHCPIELKLK